MAVLSDLPNELVLQIFSHIKYEDRFETFKVSYEWFFLTLKTYKDKMTPENDLLVSMADFFNKAMGAKKYSSWMQLFRYMKPKKVEVTSSDSPAYIKAVEKCKPSIQDVVVDMGQFLTEFWKSYPNLRYISVGDGFVPKDKVKIPKDAFGSLFIPQLVCKAPGHYFDFRLECVGSNFALSTVTLEFGALPRAILAAALKAIKESQMVERFIIINPVITTKWNKVFPASVCKLMLIDPVIKDSVVPQVKDLLLFLCKDWSSLTSFQIHQNNVLKYQCCPMNKEERFHISWKENPSNFTHGFKCLQASIDGLRNVDSLKNSLPASVRKLELTFTEFPKEFSPKPLFSGPPQLHTLTLQMPMINSLSFGDFSGFASLHTLNLSCIGPKALETIFLSLPCLKFLTSEMSEEGTFTRLPVEVVSKSLTTLALTGTPIVNSFILRNVPCLKNLFIMGYDSKKHQLGFLCSSFYNLDYVIIGGTFDPLLCRAIGSNLADYPYKCIIADWRFPSVTFTYVLSRNVEPFRKWIQPYIRSTQQTTIYFHGFSSAFLNKKPNLKTYSRIAPFLTEIIQVGCGFI